MSMEEDILQQTIAWQNRRNGKCTSLRVTDILPGKKGNYLKSREDYKQECLMGRFGIPPQQIYVSKAMQRGVECEGFARYNYEQKHGIMVEQISFIDHPFIKNAGSSPDGLVNLNGQLEIKCPNSGTHFLWILEGVVPEEHKPQMGFQMACSGREWVDFVSFDDRCPEGLQYFEIRYFRDEEYIKMLEKEVSLFNAEVDELYKKLTEKLKGEKNEN